MNPHLAALFNIQALTLNSKFQHLSPEPESFTETVNKPLVLTEQLQRDIEQAMMPKAIGPLIQGEQVLLDDTCLQLPSAKMTSEQKQQLWRQIGEQLDAL